MDVNKILKEKGVEALILELLPKIKKRKDSEAYAWAIYGLVRACNKVKHDCPYAEKFIWRTVRGYTLDYFKKNKVVNAPDNVEIIECIEEMYPSQMKTNYSDTIEVFLSSLEDIDKRIVLHLLDGYNISEVAVVLGVSQPYVSQRISPLKTKLLIFLKKGKI